MGDGNGRAALTEAVRRVKADLSAAGPSARDCPSQLRQLLSQGTTSLSHSSALLKHARAHTASAKNDRDVKCKATNTCPVLLLSSKEKRAVATEIANSTLALLSARARKSSSPTSTGKADRSPLKQLGTNSISSPTKDSEKPKSVRSLSRDTSVSVSAISECCQIAFSYLRSTSSSFNGRICDGSLVLCGRLLSNNQHDLVITELTAIKNLLEGHLQDKPHSSVSKISGTGETADVSQLLNLRLCPSPSVDLLRRAIIYQSHVLKTIANTSKISLTKLILALENTQDSPAALVLRYLESTGDREKCAAYMENISATLLLIAPANASSIYRQTTQPSDATHAKSRLRIQSLALSLRRQWWGWASHEGDTRHSAEFFLRAIKNYLRDFAEQYATALAYETIKQCYKLVNESGISSQFITSLEIKNELRRLSIQAANLADAAMWLSIMHDDIDKLPENHSSKIMVLISEISNQSTDGAAEKTIDDAAITLTSKVCGNFQHHKSLLSTLDDLMATAQWKEKLKRYPITSRRLMLATLRFAQWLYSQNQQLFADQLYSVLQKILRSEIPQTELLHAFRNDTVILLVRRGTLQSVVERAIDLPSKAAWQSSRDTIMLSHVISLLTTKAMRSANGQVELVTSVIPDCSSMEAALVLEVQLWTVLKHARRQKYQQKLKILSREIFAKLASLCQTGLHPLRWRILSRYALQAHDHQLINQQELKTWLGGDEDISHLSDDQSLYRYKFDILACRAVATFLNQPQTSLKSLEKAFQLWQALLDEDDEKRQDFYDKDITLLMLDQLAAYQQAMGHDTQLFRTLEIKVALQEQQVTTSQSSQWLTKVRIIEQLVHCGYEGQATILCTTLAQSLKNDEVLAHSKLQIYSALAEVHLQNHELVQCEQYIEKAAAIGVSLTQTSSLKDDDAGEILRACAKVWLVRSKFCLRTGSTEGALHAAKQAVKVTNSAWHHIDARHARPLDVEDSIEDSDVASKLSAGVSKLRLRPTETQDKCDQKMDSGAEYWSTVPLSCTALIHLSDIYGHLGDFCNADIYSQRAITISSAIADSHWQRTVHAHRAVLLTKAGMHEDAELQLNKTVLPGSEGSPASIKHFLALAFLKSEAHDLTEAKECIEEAQTQANAMDKAVGLLLSTINTHVRCSGDKAKQHKLSTVRRQVPAAASRRTKREQMQPTQKVSSRGTIYSSKPSNNAQSSQTDPVLASHVYITSISKDISLRRALILQQSGQVCEIDGMLAANVATLTMGSQVRQLQARIAMQHHMARLRQDLRYNALHEMVMLFPAHSIMTTASARKSSLVKKTATKSKSTTRSAARKPRDLFELDQEGMLLSIPRRTAASYLQSVKNMPESMFATADIRNEKHCLVEALTYETTSAQTQQGGASSDMSLGFYADYASTIAHKRQKNAYMMREGQASATQSLPWPSGSTQPDESLVESQFQSQYVDIIPRSWTVASLQLDQTGNRLQVVRYRSGEEPTVISLPFARHEPDMEDEMLFDYQAAKHELTDIIERSNKTCHAGTDQRQKLAKADWWSEREDLDRRLGFLLTALEERWLGGFRGVLSTRLTSEGRTTAFRQVLETIMNRHLCSPICSRQGSPLYSLNDTIIELFISLGTDTVGADELENAVLDLLNFVLDSMRLRGNDIVHDEIDFDRMVMDICEAITDHSGPASDNEDENRHLVLVLDKRLQLFPWESMPYLDNVSVSRVGSLQSLREQILAMRSQCVQSKDTVERYSIRYSQGTTILNPASDLAQTQAALMPSLTALQASKHEWKLLANHKPSEEEFSKALQESSVMLYFGHGSGAQYIRPQVIRRLKKRSDVVWLMGCSSGAVVEHGSFEPSCIPSSYLLSNAGSETAQTDEVDCDRRQCLAVLANLWDVTDKDIDRFSISVGEEWGLWPAASTTKPAPQAARHVDARAISGALSEHAKTPKTPMSKHSIHRSRTPSRNGRKAALAEEHAPVGLAKAVSRSRDACFLRYLNGAAPVVYGVPVYLDRHP